MKKMVYIKDAEQERIIRSFFNNEISYKTIPSSFTQDKNFLLELVSNFGLVFEDLDNKYKEDKQIILAAVKNNANVVNMVNEKFLYDRDFVKKMLKLNACCISRLPDAVAYDFEMLNLINGFLKRHQNLYNSYFEYLEKCKRESKLMLSINEKEKQNIKKKKKKI